VISIVLVERIALEIYYDVNYTYLWAKIATALGSGIIHSDITVFFGMNFQRAMDIESIQLRPTSIVQA
jgi:hypothetical protein